MADDHDRRCLLVGHDEAVTDIIALMLEKCGYSVERARNAEQAMARAEVGRFELAVIDGQDRLALARAIKATFAQTRVILTTGNPGPLEVDGIDSILRKPFSDDDLMKDLSPGR